MKSKTTAFLAALLAAAAAHCAPLATENFVTNKIAAAISQIPPPDYSTNNTELVDTIEATAPAPGDYAAVSNAAVYAAITNALQDTALAGTATKADATLTERGHSAWELISYPGGIDAISDFTVSPYEYGGEPNVYTLYIEGHYDDGDISTDFYTSSIEPAQGTDTRCSFDCYGPWGIDSFVVSRTALPGYVLGGDTNHILAAQNQVDELGSSVASNAAAVAALEDTTSTLSQSLDGKADKLAIATVSTSDTDAAEIRKDAVPLNGDFSDDDLGTGKLVWVRFGASNTRSAPTLKVGSMSTAKRMYQATGSAAFNAWDAGALVLFQYNPSLNSGAGGWRAVALADGTPHATTSTAGITMLSNSAGDDETKAATPKAVKDATAGLATTGDIESIRVDVESNAAAISNLTDTTSALRDSIPSVALTNETLYVNGWKTNVVTRYANGAVTLGSRTGAVGVLSVAEGDNTTASGYCSHAEGYNTAASGAYSHVEGCRTMAGGNFSHAVGYFAVVTHNDSWCWQGVNRGTYYYSHGHGTFNINPSGGTDGFWIGETNFTQHVRNIAGSGGGGSAAPKRIAMFIVPVNQKPQIKSFNSYPAYGFELKATTNNFASAASESVKLQFYSQSEIADTGSPASGSSLGIDRMKLYMTTTNETSDIRSLDRIDNTIPFVGKELQEVVVLVDATCLVRHPEDNGAWLSEDNEDLTWCYLRDDANDGVETRYDSDKPLWRPIAPVKWFSKMPAWAN